MSENEETHIKKKRSTALKINVGEKTRNSARERVKSTKSKPAKGTINGMDLFVCGKCGANLIECGVTEVTIGGIGETDISFKKDALYPINKSGNEVEYGIVDVHDFDDQWVVCRSCGAELHDRTAIEIIEAFENDLPHILSEAS